MTGWLRFCWLALFVVLSSAMAQPTSQKALSFLALGDSYTIGEAVTSADRWPDQLVAALVADGIDVQPPRIIAQTGWTTDELMEAIAGKELEPSYDLVSVLIGVNNQYRKYPIEQYRQEFAILLGQALDLADHRKDRVFAISIPNYGMTPFGQTRDPDEISREIEQYNAIAGEICQQMGIAYIDITPISEKARDMPELTATDRLHPSGRMYQLWVEAMLPTVKSMISR